MKAAITTKYGPPDVMQIREVEKPVPKDNEVLIKVYASSVSSGDCRMRSFDCPVLFWIPMRLALGVTKPRKPIQGFMIAGLIESVGKKVKKFEKGDRVYGAAGLLLGGYAEYACLPEKNPLALMPLNMTYDEAAAVPFGGGTALHFLRKAGIKKGQKVLIYGASGAVGTSSVQIAKYFGAEVTGVCSGANLKLVKSLGADKVIDYTKEDFTQSGESYDIIFDAVGKIPRADRKKSLKPGGKYMTVLGLESAKDRSEDLIFLKDLVETEKLKAVIDRRYPLEQIVEAHKYVELGHKKGNVVITIVPKIKS